MNLWESIRGKERRSLQEYVDILKYAGNAYGITGKGIAFDAKQEEVEPTFAGYVEALYKSNPVVWGCILARLSLFAEARFKYRRLVLGRPGELFGTTDLEVLEKPWPGGSTGDLLTRAIQDVDLGGNFFAARTGVGELRRLRPDWTTIILGSKSDPEGGFGSADVTVLGYSYKPGGRGSGKPAEAFLAEHVAHFAPYPDPVAAFRGMSWVTPAIREILGDQAATMHKLNYLEQGAVPNTVVTVDASITREEFEKWVELFKEEHEGLENAYKCLHPETEVALWNGARCPAGEVQVGDTVVAWAEGRPQPGLVAAAEWQPASPIVTVRTERGRRIKTNDAHPFLTKNGWVRADALKKGDLLRTGLAWGRPRLQDSLDAREAWMIGLLVGDGCFTQSRPTVSIANGGVAQRLAATATLVKFPIRDKAPYDYGVKGIKPLVRQLGLNGKRAYEKRIPEAVMTGSESVVCAFLSGLIDADGHVADPARRPSCELGITSTSLPLLQDAQHLLASLGVNSSVSSPRSMTARADSSGRRKHDGHRLVVLGNQQATALASLLDLSHDEKARRLAEYAARPGHQERWRFDRIESVTVTAPEPTIGIEVAGHHTHVTGGVVTHNTIFLGAGSSIEVVGNDLRRVDFKAVQAIGENRIAVAAGVPGIVAGLSEGLEAATLANYGQARRRFADGTIRPLWRGICEAMETIVPIPAGAQLWYDDRDIAFLQDDKKDEAEIQQKQALTLELLVKAGFEPDSAVSAVLSNDMARLVHTGLVSVQLQEPGASPPPEPSQNGAGAQPPQPALKP